MLDTHVHAVSPPGRVGSAPEPTGLTLTPLASPTTQRQSLRHPTATFLRALNACPPTQDKDQPAQNQRSLTGGVDEDRIACSSHHTL